MIRGFDVASVLVASLLAGCGGKVVYSEGAGGSGGASSTASTSSTSKGNTSAANGSTGSAGLSCTKVSFDFNAPIDACGTNDTCDITGTLADGRSLRETCKLDGKTASCALFVDGVEVCSCPLDRLNYAATCTNGAPTCLGWDVDYSDISYCHIK